MSLTLELTADQEADLGRIASERGLSAEEFVRKLLVDGVFGKQPRPWREIVGPIAADFAASGMTEEDLDALVEEAREEIYFEQHGRRSKRP